MKPRVTLDREGFYEGMWRVSNGREGEWFYRWTDAFLFARLLAWKYERAS